MITPFDHAPIHTAHLFPAIDAHLLGLLRSLRPEDWSRRTLAKLWSVKDIVAHLLDGNIRTLSLQRDGYFGEQPPENVQLSYQNLVMWLNTLNHDWVKAAQRISPAVLILLHEITAPQTHEYFSSLDLFAPAIFSVAWAGEAESMNWMHIAREYTEKWHHQQQIREAVGQTAPLMCRELFYPCIETFMRALPYGYRAVEASEGAVVRVSISSEAGGDWYIQKTTHEHNDQKQIISQWSWCMPTEAVTTHVTLPPDVAWKLFTKGLSAHEARKYATIEGNPFLGEPVFAMTTVMA